jgi:DNA-binding transcriptional LysR family regulator
MNLDLNLLRVFLAVYETRNISQASITLGMSQPGLSTALGRLRTILQDPIFIRTSRGMEPTSRAQALLVPIRTIVNSINSDLFVAPTFEASTSTREFRIALSDIGEGIYLPNAIRGLQESAPSASLRSLFMPPKQLEEEMAAGNVDLAIGYFPDITSSQFFQRRVGLHSFGCIVRMDHPEVGARLTMEQFSTLGHVIVEAPGRSQEVFENFLKMSRFERKVVLRTPHFMSVPVIVANTDVIAVVPQALADFSSTQKDFRQVQLPFMPPIFQVNLYWHRSAQLDPGNKWLREIMISCFPEIQRRAYHRNGGKQPALKD